jgi:hypothetical protein
MNTSFKNFSILLFLIIIVASGFPFITFSYGSQNPATLNGFDILQIQKEEEITEPNVTKQIPLRPVITSENLVSVSLLSASIGIATSWVRYPQSAVIAAIAGGIGSGSLWYFKDSNEAIVLKGEQGIERVDFGWGFFVSLISYIAVTIVNLIRIFQGKR